MFTKTGFKLACWQVAKLTVGSFVKRVCCNRLGKGLPWTRTRYVVVCWAAVVPDRICSQAFIPVCIPVLTPGGVGVFCFRQRPIRHTSFGQRKELITPSVHCIAFLVLLYFARRIFTHSIVRSPLVAGLPTELWHGNDASVPCSLTNSSLTILPNEQISVASVIRIDVSRPF